jgi:hypothetical protein
VISRYVYIYIYIYINLYYFNDNVITSVYRPLNTVMKSI